MSVPVDSKDIKAEVQTTNGAVSDTKQGATYADFNQGAIRNSDPAVIEPGAYEQRCTINWEDEQMPEEVRKPVKYKDLKWIKAFGILSVVIFFPFGIPACYYAFKAEEEYEIGLQKGDLDLATKYARRSQKYTILSIIFAILVGVVVIAIIARISQNYKHPNRKRDSLWNNMGLGTPVG